MTSTDKYMIDEQNRLIRAGEHIGDLQENGEMKLNEKGTKFRAVVTRWLREKADQQEEEEAKAPPATEAEKLAEDEKIMAEARNNNSRVTESHKDDLAFAKKNGIPAPPMKNPKFAEKTPAYVDWLEKHRLDKFKQLFEVTGRGKRAIIKRNPDTGIDEVSHYEDCWIARRKTHLTEKSSDTKGLTSDMSWDA